MQNTKASSRWAGSAHLQRLEAKNHGREGYWFMEDSLWMG